MRRLTLIVLALSLAAPLGALTPSPGARADPKLAVRLERVEVSLTVSRTSAAIRAVWTLHNRGEAIELQVGLPRAGNRAAVTGFSARVDGIQVAEFDTTLTALLDEQAETDKERKVARKRAERRARHWYVWTLALGAGARTVVEVEYAAPTVLDAISHPLGRRSIDFDLTTDAAWSGTVGTTEITVRLAGLAPEQVLAKECLPAAIEWPVDDEGAPGTLVLKFADVEPTHDLRVVFVDTTAKARRTELEKVLAAFKPAQQIAENKAYLRALVELAEVREIQKETEAALEMYQKLAGLEIATGRAVSFCGPWATWRKYVPWCLRQLEALDSLGRLDEAKSCAEESSAFARERWLAYREASGKRRPFENFDSRKYGNYWDYDWERTRRLYIRSLELLEDEEALAEAKAN